MARSKDIFPSQQGWLHELARAEIHPDAERLLQLGRSFDPQQLVEESTIDFLTELRDCFEEYSRVFNGYSEEGTRFSSLKIYQLAQSAADFMIFRNQVKLIVSNSAHGVIQLAFAKHVRGAMSVDGQMSSSNADDSAFPLHGHAHELVAQIGPFRDVAWTFQGEKVTADQVARFYFAEFVRATRENRRSKASNQLLLEQIKSLLQEKGLDL